MSTTWKTLFVFLAAALLSAGMTAAQEAAGVRYIDASGLTLVGKMMDTPDPYWRVDTTRFKGFTPRNTALSTTPGSTRAPCTKAAK